MMSLIEDIVNAARVGRPVIMIDAETRKNEGHLILPAQFVDSAAINFMATHCRGIISLAITSEQARVLGLKPMVRWNDSRFQMAYTVSIEAKHGVSTGISTEDRARTIRAAINPEATASDIVTPGHVFPIVADDGGVTARPGHTEAAIEICERAGLFPAAVLCAIMSADGSMAGREELRQLAGHHNLPIGRVSDLAYPPAQVHPSQQLGTLPFASRDCQPLRYASGQ